MSQLVRVSIGTAICIGLDSGYLSDKPTTAYLLTYYHGRCNANCAFCTQARLSSSDIDMLSRLEWPPYVIDRIKEHLSDRSKAKKIKRICLQGLDYPGVEDDLIEIIESLKADVSIPVSISCSPISRKKLEELVNIGVDRIGISLDAATEEVFNKIKGKGVGSHYIWSDFFGYLNSACGFFEENHVVVHLIAGLGETEMEMVRLINNLHLMNAYPALFAFTPVPGTLMEKCARPSIAHYRRIQLASYLITEGYAQFEKMKFDAGGRVASFGVTSDILTQAVLTGKPFLTTGCPDCNRPYYNESPGGPIYNYPRPLLMKEIKQVERQLFQDFSDS